MTIANKKYFGYAIGLALALLITAPALFGAVSNVNAAAADDNIDFYFGGEQGGTASEFATSTGLGEAELTATIANIINIALGFLGIIAVVIILLGGFKWMTSGGNDKKLEDAKKLIFSGIIGLVIVLFAFAIATFVIRSITQATAS